VMDVDDEQLVATLLKTPSLLLHEPQEIGEKVGGWVRGVGGCKHVAVGWTCCLHVSCLVCMGANCSIGRACCSAGAGMYDRRVVALVEAQHIIVDVCVAGSKSIAMCNG
jgi:hypothetical protein